MNTRRARIAISVALSLIFLTAASCGGLAGHYPVHGRVLCNGQPAEGVDVRFYPKGSDNPNPHIAHAETDANGDFTLECRDGPGAMPGDYLVALRLLENTASMARAHRNKGGGIRAKSIPADVLKNAYADLNKPKFTATIQAGSNELEPFEIKVDQKTFDEYFKNN
jgi:5-hydroxyisourate hydrolase-like protein (transthyretin family)